MPQNKAGTNLWTHTSVFAQVCIQESCLVPTSHQKGQSTNGTAYSRSAPPQSPHQVQWILIQWSSAGTTRIAGDYKSQNASLYSTLYDVCPRFLVSFGWISFMAARTSGLTNLQPMVQHPLSHTQMPNAKLRRLTIKLPVFSGASSIGIPFRSSGRHLSAWVELMLLIFCFRDLAQIDLYLSQQWDAASN